MASLDDLRRTFFDECGELLQDVESSLTQIDEGSGSEDTIHALFRAVHSIKGGAGIFGFDVLVSYAHVLETVLDAMRHGTLAVGPDVTGVLFTAGDTLADLVTMAKAGDAVPEGYGAESRRALQQLLGQDGDEDLSGGPAADFDDIAFVPVRFDAEDSPAEPRSYGISFRPKAEMLKNGHDPLALIGSLRGLGELELVAEVAAMPGIAELDPAAAYIGWSGTLKSEVAQSVIEEVFLPAQGMCDVEIKDVSAPALVPEMPEPSPIGMPGDPPPVAAAPAPMETVAAETAPAAPPMASAPAPAKPEFVSEEAAPAAMVPAKAAKEAKEAKEERPAAAAAAGAKATPMTTRVELEKIDRVVNMVGELVIAQAMLGQAINGLHESVSGQFAQVLEAVIHHTRELKDSVMSMRAQPVSAVFQRMPRLIRELSAKTGKKVRLEMAGENTEVDRTIIEGLSDPLTHIIRNSVDHGIETPAARQAAGKDEEGTIRLAAEHRGGRIVIEIKDDGAGLDHERVLKKARERGLVDPEAQLTPDEINNLIFLPGFSTAEQISDISGRGVGMDVVRRNIQKLGGRILINSERGKGMTIQFALPLTLAVLDGMVIKAAQETYVMPMASIVECLRPSNADLHRLHGTAGMLQLRGELLPLVQLSTLLDLGNASAKSEEAVVMITDAGDGQRFGLLVDELCGHQQVVIKSIEESYQAVPGIAGATILGNGRVAFILDAERLSELAAERQSAASRSMRVEAA
jgi:two-component system chemotaxis sensor kinase CheA